MLGIFSAIPMGKVTKSLLVCATPRSGSTLLCALLDGTGVAGRPQEYFERLSSSGLPRQPREYFEGVEDPELLGLLAPTDPGTPDAADPIPEALEQGTTDNGVFAAKLMWTHLLDLADRLGRPPDTALLAERFPGPHYVRVTRRDKVAQAVSLWRAVQTRAWRAGEVTENGNAVYHAGAIGYLASQLSDHDEAWRTWFAANGIQPLTIVYEELVVDTHAATAAVLDHLGAGPATIPEPPLRRQGDDRSARWLERYRA
jgi:LPS sulfotransferase NodH